MELPQLDTPPSFDGKGRSSTNCGIGRCVGLNSGRVCLLPRRHFAPTMRAWRGVRITASGQKTPMFVAYRRLERGASRYRSLSLPSGVSIAHGLENIRCANNIRLSVQSRLSDCSRRLATSRDRNNRELPQWRKHSASSRFKCGAASPNDITPGIVNIPAPSIVHVAQSHLQLIKLQ